MHPFTARDVFHAGSGYRFCDQFLHLIALSAAQPAEDEGETAVVIHRAAGRFSPSASGKISLRGQATGPVRLLPL